MFCIAVYDQALSELFRLKFQHQDSFPQAFNRSY